MDKKKFFITALAALAVAAGLATLFRSSRTALIVDGKRYISYSLKKVHVKDLVDKFKVAVSSADIVEPALDATLKWGSEAKVVRVTEETEEVPDEVDFVLDWKRRTNKNLRAVEIQTGHKEKVTYAVRRTFHDGKEVKTEKKKKKVKKIPVTRLLLLDKKGQTEKVYDLSKTKKIRLLATAYWTGDPQVPGTETYSGHQTERGLVAVDPKVLPLGMRLYIPSYGYAYSSDTGSAIKGKRIDLFVESKKASRRWEHVKVDVYLLEKAPNW